MKILHINDVASVGSILVRASKGRDQLYQPALRRFFPAGRVGAAGFAWARARDIARIRTTYSQGRFTRLHVHYGTFGYLAELAGLEYSVHVHGGEVTIHPREGGLKHWLSQRALTQAKKVVVSTPDLLEPVLKIRPDSVYIPNPMELPPVSPPRAPHPLPRIFMLSKMDDCKGWPAQIAVMQRIVARMPGLSFSFTREGQLPINHRENLTEALLALGGTVRPWVPREMFLRLLSAHDFALGQLELGAMGMSEMEALAFGLPTIANVSAHTALGYHPPVLDPSTAHETVARLWQGSEGARRTLAEASRQYIGEIHDPEARLAELSSFLE